MERGLASKQRGRRQDQMTEMSNLETVNVIWEGRTDENRMKIVERVGRNQSIEGNNRKQEEREWRQRLIRKYSKESRKFKSRETLNELNQFTTMLSNDVWDRSQMMPGIPRPLQMSLGTLPTSNKGGIGHRSITFRSSIGAESLQLASGVDILRRGDDCCSLWVPVSCVSVTSLLIYTEVTHGGRDRRWRRRCEGGVSSE